LPHDASGENNRHCGAFSGCYWRDQVVFSLGQPEYLKPR
jgi:hypothetical protein